MARNPADTVHNIGNQLADVPGGIWEGIFGSGPAYEWTKERRRAKEKRVADKAWEDYQKSGEIERDRATFGSVTSMGGMTGNRYNVETTGTFDEDSNSYDVKATVTGLDKDTYQRLSRLESQARQLYANSFFN